MKYLGIKNGVTKIDLTVEEATYALDASLEVTIKTGRGVETIFLDLEQVEEVLTFLTDAVELMKR